MNAPFANVSTKNGTETAQDAPPATPGEADEEAGTLAEGLRRQLEHAITSGELRPGQRLDEQELAQRYEVSRTPVREALRLLAAQHLVTLRGRQGAVVRQIDTHALIEMFVVMAEMEGLCARLACRRMTPQTLQRILAIHEELRQTSEAGDIELFFQANRAFHEAIYDASCNAFLAEETRALRNRVSAYRRRMSLMPGRVHNTLAQHQLIIDAIRSQDPEQAYRAMRDHVNLAGDDLMDFIAWNASHA
jgi:DNA-binding GntR family transcriptional regulator